MKYGEYFKELKQHKPTDWGFATAPCLDKFYDEVVLLKSSIIVELGVNWGTSTSGFLIACANTQINGHPRLYSVDIEPCLKARKEIKRIGLDKYWTFTQMDDISFLKKFDKKIDILFADSSKDKGHVAEILETAKTKMNEKSTIFVHDVFLKRHVLEEVKTFIAQNKEWRHEIFNVKWGLSILRRGG